MKTKHEDTNDTTPEPMPGQPPPLPERLTRSKRIDASKRIVKALDGLPDEAIGPVIAFLREAIEGHRFEALARAVASLDRLHEDDRRDVVSYIGALVGES